ncbi:hypothetical protein EZS27_013489 [termite gut metagenome]|uniref:Uncharacterized protein n=1 Tax=termite gut metagenome TaxID=433724 RepID=A0A5J4RXH1_9ZZZZ
MNDKEEIEKLSKEDAFYRLIAGFHEQRIIDDKISIADREFHARKLNYYKSKYEETSEQITQIYKRNKNCN